jgi:formylglycine-generating enzyme
MRQVASLLVVVGICSVVQASVVFNTVPVGNPGNAPDTRYATPGYGAVSYRYDIGQYEVTTAEYCSFLNAVAASDTYGVYSPYMDTVASAYGCNIKRSGGPGFYTYTVGNGSPTDVTNWANRPVNWVSWGDAARFANWMSNGQPTGPQNAATTEDGSYALNGATSDADLLAVTRKPNARWVIPTEDEWYKAAYHKNDGTTGNYWEFPLSSDSIPSNVLIDPDPGNSANFFSSQSGMPHYTIGAPYWRTPVGAFENSDSPYGTFDQGGNLWEWNESDVSASYRGIRGGSFWTADSNTLAAWSRGGWYPSVESFNYGFRVALVPEPATLTLLALGGLAVLRRRR